MLAESVKKANDAILHYAAANAGTSGMGTTLVAVRFCDNKFSIAHVGDSRIYLFRDGELLQLTEDHSLVMEQVRRGILTLEEAKVSTAQNIITRALGTDESTLPDLGEFPAQVGDTVLMTTDGILRHVSDEEIRSVLRQIPSLQAACDTLIDAANEAGGNDNSTCLLLRVVNQPAGDTARKADLFDTDSNGVPVARSSGDKQHEPETPADGVTRPDVLGALLVETDPD